MVEMEDEICPKSICSDTGGIQAAYQSIVCLPNQIIVRSEGAKDDDEILWSLKLNSRIYTMKVMNLNNVKLMITFNSRALLNNPGISWIKLVKGVLIMHMKFHTVKRGETLWKIAHHHHTSVHHLLHMNPSINNPDLIYIGQRIKIH